MSARLDNPQYNKWKKLHTCFMLLTLVFYMLCPLAEEYWGSVYHFYFKTALPIAAAFYFYFRGFEAAVEIKLGYIFFLWFVLTRIINGDISLTVEGNIAVNMAASVLLLALCPVLEKNEREKLLDWVCVIVPAFFTVLGIVSIYAAVYQMPIVNPFSQHPDSFIVGSFRNRLVLLDKNPNICCNWLFISFFMSVYEFIKHRKWYFRVPAVLAALVNYFAISLTSSRSATLGLGFCLSLLIGVWCFGAMIKRNKKAIGAVTAVLIVVLLTPLIYKSFSLSTRLLNMASQAVTYEDSSAPDTSEGNGVSGHSYNEADDSIGRKISVLKDTGRIEIYESFFYTMKKDPARLIKGCLFYDEMKYSEEYIDWSYAHFHNTFLQSADYTGIPGFVMVVLFFVLLMRRAVKLMLSPDAGLELKALAVPVFGIFLYNMVESSSFYIPDFRQMAFFLMAGAIIAYCDELCPKKTKA